MKKKPVFFISSTIYDFKDLRSAIKFYLEEQGCTVLASEFNDFGQPIDEHSYAACLKQINNADYFILLIGSRIGGIINKEKRLTITREEYRAAYELHKAGKLKIVAMVRSEVWALKEDRKELASFLDTLEIDSTVGNAIKKRPGKGLTDADFVIEFLEEIGKNKETAAAARGNGLYPTGNWIHQFSNFKEVIDVLRAQIFLGRPIEHEMGLQLLRNELTDTVAKLLIKIRNGKVVFPFKMIENFAKKYPLQAEELMQEVSVSKEDLQRIFPSIIHFEGLKIEYEMLTRSLKSGLLLKFDAGTDRIKEEPLFQIISDIRREIKSFMENREDEKLSMEILKILGPRSRSTLNIQTHRLVIIQGFMDRAFNIASMSIAVLRHLDGEPFANPVLRPRTPLIDQVQGLEEERVTTEDVANYLSQTK